MDAKDREYVKNLEAQVNKIKKMIDDIYPDWLQERHDELGKRKRRRFDVNPEQNLWFSQLYGNPMACRSRLQTMYAAMEDFLLDIIEFSTEFVEDGEPDSRKDFEKFFRTFRSFPGTFIFGKCEKDKFEDRLVPDDVTLIDKIKETITETEFSELRFEFGRNDSLPFLGDGQWADEYSADDPLIIRVYGFPYTNQGWNDDKRFELPAKRTTSDITEEVLNICRKIQHARDLHNSIIVPLNKTYKREGLGNSVYVNFDPDNETFYFEKFDVPEKESVVLDLDKKEWPLRAKSHVFNDNGWDKEALNKAYKPEIEKHIAEFGPLTFDYSFDLDISHRPNLGPLDWYNKEQVKERAKYHEKKYLYGHLTITLNDNSDPAQAVEFYKHMKAIDFNKLKEKVHFE